MKTLIATVTYNEIGNIEDFCHSVLAINPKFHFLVVDDNSPDGTGQLLDKLARKSPRIKVIHRPGKLGIASAHMATFLYAIQNNYDTLVTMDADLSHDPREIPKLLAALDGFDFVLGSRFAPGGTSEYTGYRKMVSILGNLSARLLLRIPFKETTTSFRVFQIDTLRKINLGRMPASGYSFFFELVYRLQSLGARGNEVPIHFSDRFKGKSKVGRGEVAKSLYKLLSLAFFELIGRAHLSPAGKISESGCYFCNSTLIIEKLDKPQILECLACGLRFAANRSNLKKNHPDFPRRRYLDNPTSRRKTLRRAWHRVSGHLPEDGKLLEVGSDEGYFLKLAAESGFRVEGTEESASRVDAARKGLGEICIHQGAFGAIQKKLSRDFDAVMLWDELENLADPIQSLSQINSILKDRGWLCFSTLDVSNWFPRLLRANWPWYLVNHRFYFSNRNLHQFLDLTGFEIRRVVPHRYYASLKFVTKILLRMTGLEQTALGKGLLMLAPGFIQIPINVGDIKLYICQKVSNGQKQLPKKTRTSHKAA